MRIGIDARYIVNRSGFGNYAAGLLEALARTDQTNQYVVYLDARSRDAESWQSRLSISGENFQFKCLSYNNSALAEHVSIPRLAQQDGLDILHCLFNTAPVVLPKGLKLALTLHDAIFAVDKHELPVQPGLRSWLIQHYFRLLAPKAARRASIVFTDSEYSKGDLIARLKLPAAKIRVVYLAPNGEFLQPQSSGDELESRLKAIGVTRPFVLGYGSSEPRKNTAALLEAYSALKRTGRIAHTLVLIGATKSGFAATEFARFVRDHGLDHDVLIPGTVSTQDLRALYTAADVFVYPTLYEGFGLPILEAMACGTAVVSSNTTSVPEIAGDGAVLVDSRKPYLIAEAISSLLDDASFAKRIRATGERRARDFSWDQTARLVISGYQEIIEE